ncbi:MAG: copper resistance protein CopC [Candidatus Rokubacteria bacterium]|nr:copper resistance protein CopC [Candidatus Rokubacteria bacterium]
MAALIALAMVLLEPLPAAAHAVLVEASPPPRARLSRPPARVTLVFSERLEPAYARLWVSDDAGRRVDQGDASLGPDDPRRLSVTLPPLPPGRYTVKYRVLSVDGHAVESSLTFTVTGGSP